jgi:nucleoside-diphosphate-sugar epimerase
MYARTRGWQVQGAMIFQAYGPGQPPQTLIPAAFRAALAGDSLAMSSGQQERDWIYVGDVIRGLVAAVTTPLAPGVTAEFGTGQSTSVEVVVRRIYELVGRGGEPRVGARPDRPGEVQRQVADLQVTGRLLTWEPEITLSEGLRRVYSALLAGEGAR